MPLVYYPDISFDYPNPAGTSYYYHVGYRTALSATYTEAELYKTTTVNLRNQCENLILQLMPNPLTITPIPVFSGPTPTIQNTFPLNQINVPFTVTSCDPFLSNDEEIEGKMGMYPNPADNFVYFTATNLKNYKVIDALGRTISQGVFTDDASINVSSLNQGLYLVNVFDGSGKIQTFKLLKK